MFRSLTFCVLSAALLSAANLFAAESPLAPAFTFEDVEQAQSFVIEKGVKAKIDADRFQDRFQNASPKRTRPEVEVKSGLILQLVFKKPIPVGTSLLSISGGDLNRLAPQILRKDFAGAIDKIQDTDWRDVALTQTFEVGTTTRAVRLVAKDEYRGPVTWLFIKPRLINLTSSAVGSGERAPFGAHPNAIPRGEVWFNTGKDTRPGAAKQLQRGPVSEALPSWYVLSWDKPQTLSALWLSSNTDGFRLLAYRGQEGLNPAVAPASAWRRIDFTTSHEQLAGGDRLNDRLIQFAELKTVALKLEMTSCRRGATAAIGQMLAFTDARNEEATITGPSAGGSKEIAYVQPFDGQLAMVITNEQGQTIRNLVAQVDRKKGASSESWDLKDNMGLTVPPGKYRWKAITSPPIQLQYQMSVYPNVSQIHPDRTPWLTGESGANGWLADHASITSGASCGDKLYFGAPGVEAGVSLIECDLTGRKLWGKHSFAPFSGVGRLAGDDESLYIQERDFLHRLDPKTRTITRLTTLSSAERKGEITSLAAHAGEVALSLNSPVPWIDNATRADNVDLENCIPKFAARIADPLGSRRVTPNPRVDFLRLLRLTGTPAGQGAVAPDRRESIFPITIDSAGDDGKYQYVLLAFNEPVPLGSLILPCVGPEYLVDLSVLKPDAKYPPDLANEKDWLPCPEKPRPGWTCVPMPEQLRTRALRIRVRLAKEAGETDLIDDLLAEKKPKKEPSAFELDIPKDPGAIKPDLGSKPVTNWFARFEGMKLLRRRFSDVTATAKVRVSSGEVNAQGEWDAKRTEALSTEDPGIYVMEWAKPQTVAALAIKEIDGAVTEIDLWDEPTATSDEIPLTTAPQWKHVATYQQTRRDGYEPDFNRSDSARYMDGYVDFGGERTTRAIRLRVVSQWADNGERGTSCLRNDLGGRSLDPRRCRIWGVAALKYLGEEPPLDTLAYQRIELRDGQTGKVTREISVKPPVEGRKSAGASSAPHSLAYRSDGELFGVHNGRVVRIDKEAGTLTNALPAIDGEKAIAHRMTIAKDGSFFVHVFPEQLIHVYDAQGKQVRTIGHPGGQKPGPWDPEKFYQVETLVVDGKGQLWVVESQDVPRRIVQYDAQGRFAGEFLGNTHYGGGGVLDPADESRLIYGHIEFEIDWKTGKSKIKNMLAPWMREDLVPVRHAGQTYLVSTPLSHNASQAAAFVYRYDEARGQAALVAGFGEANSFEPLKKPAVLKQLADGKVPKDYMFIWSDENDNGEVDPDEVAFDLKPSQSGNAQLGRFNDRLQCWAGSFMYQPKSVSPQGVIAFEKIVDKSSREGSFEFASGTLLAMRAKSELPTDGSDEGQETRGITPDGQVAWRYPTSHPGVSGLFLPPWSPGYVTNEFGIIGFGKAALGELGEYVIVSGNNGMWKIWTADGFLAGQITRHKFDPRSTVDSSHAKAERGMSLDNLTGGQEHFHGQFVQMADGRCYIVHGFNYIGLTEVLGMNNFKRMSGEVTVTPDDVQKVRARHEELARREAKSQALVLECLPVKDDGQLNDVAERDGIKFAIGYDDESLHLRWNVSGYGALKNSGDDFHRYFKTGACLDFQLGLDAVANPGRRQPMAGDLRMLFTVADGKPKAVLYQPVVNKPQAKEMWETRTDAGGTTRFDRVVELTRAKLVHSPAQNSADNHFTFTARIPLAELDWKPEDGQLLRCDWGVLTSDDGHSVKRRIYWSNQLATGTTDEAWEARLDPHLWGTMAVLKQSRSDQQLDLASPDKKPKATGNDILDEIDLKK